MRFGMMAAVGMLAATAGMAHGERESGKPWSVPDYSRYAFTQLGFETDWSEATGHTLNPTPGQQPTVDNTGYHQNHFHIYLQPPKRVDLSKALLADANAAVSGNIVLAQETAASVITSEMVRKVEKFTSRACTEAENQSSKAAIGMPGGSMTPIGTVLTLLQTDAGFQPSGPATATLTGSPAHGKVVSRGVWFDPEYSKVPAFDHFTYVPEANFYGVDHATFEVRVNGATFRVKYTIHVLETANNGESCNNDRYIFGQAEPTIEVGLESIEGVAEPESETNTAPDATALLPILDSTGIGGMIEVTSVNFADLAGGAVGQTTGTSITLDTNAAGYGWYIDYTPYLNDEYLPTSNPNLWVAKEGTEAAGKMDLLSVLLHEYGHALGLEHSSDSGDYMAATLQPGVRRLPSSDELAFMARLVAEAKASYIASDDVSDSLPQPGTPQSPDQPGAPLPTRNGNVRTTRSRISRYGTTILNADGSDPEKSQPSQYATSLANSGATQYAIVANPTLTDAKLQTGTGWETTGTVAIGNGAAVLNETTRSQTRLNQVFTVGPNDRYLTFTLANIGLDDVDNGPDDAFEVALLNANTGSVLTGATGLTRNDAFLNLQANGIEHLGQGVTSTRNADGSRTYRLDLAGIPAGTAVNLSFDLIGFANAGSHVTVRDIRLGVPETRDDAVTTSEDTGLDIDVRGNDLDADQPGYTPVVVAGPAHGSVTLNADGSFHYVPLGDWNGEDSFTYKLSDGSVDSNVATVRITVTPVNDAPVVGDRSASTDEDAALTVDLLAGASDKVAYRHG